MSISVKDYTSEQVYSKIIEETNSSDYTKFELENIITVFKDGSLTAIQDAKNIFEVNSEKIVGKEDVKSPENNKSSTYVTLKPVAQLEGIASGITSNVTEYLAPSQATLNLANKMGEGFDKFIEDSTAAQFFGINSSDILCSTFCVVTSMLPCSVRNELYNLATKARVSLYAAETAVNAAKDMVTSVSIASGAVSSVLGATADLLGGQGDTPSGSSVGNVPFNVATVAAAAKQVGGIIDTISNSLEVVQKGKIFTPIVQHKNLWSLTNNTLFQMQGLAVQAADELLNKITQPLEDAIKKMQPSNCLNNKGASLFDAMTNSIRKTKNWALINISQLFTGYKDYSKITNEFNKECLSLLELSKSLKALKLISTRFGDLALVCGLEPCPDNPNNNNPINRGKRINQQPSYTQVEPLENLPERPEGDIDQLSNELKKILKVDIEKLNKDGVGTEDVYITDDSITTVYTAFKNAPKKVMEIVPKISLGDEYKVFVSEPTGTVKVLYNTKRLCE